eukprot:GFUD01015486.1.p1 GENE.GFUD01015486.1~~GFUD01015486.1.p1  ORF type:complete len:413 (-),score=130.19 GFUD01015486.1:19-1257(-)
MFQYANKDKTSLSAKLHEEMEGMRANHVKGSPGWDWFLNQVLTKRTDATCTVEDLDGEEKDLINMSSNTYLGLSCHPEVRQAGQEALEEFGSGVCSSRLIGGNLSLFKDLERKLATFLGKEDSLIYSSGSAANLGIFQVLLGPQDVLLSDKLNHASLIDGMRLSKATKLVYNHLDMKDLEKKLILAEKAKIKMIVTDGAFSMDGQVCPLPEIRRLADKYGAVVLVDDCHGVGVIGKTGRGTEEYHHMEGGADIITANLSKALGGGSGGIIAGSKDLIDLLRRVSRTFVFSSALSPATVACSSKVLDILIRDPAILEKLKRNTMMFRNGMKKAGFEVKGVDHPCCPVMLREDVLTWKVANHLFQNGIFVPWVVVPVSEEGEQKIRVMINAAHSEEQIQKALDLFADAKRKFID